MATEDYRQLVPNLTPYLGKLHKEKETAALLQGFGQMSKAVGADGALSNKVKELMSLAISIDKRCEECIAYHTEKAVKEGATREEVLETLATAMHMGGGPSVMYAGKALKAYEQIIG